MDHALRNDGLVFQHMTYGSGGAPNPPTGQAVGPAGSGPSPGSGQKQFSMDTSDIVAVGVVILAIGAVIVAVIIALGFVFGKVPGKEASQIIIACVSGSAISGVVAALLGRRNQTTD